MKKGNCDICNEYLELSKGEIISAEEMRKIVKKGFNPFSEGHPLLAAFGIPMNVMFENWKRDMVMNPNATDWFLCPSCLKKVEKYR